MNSSKKIAFRQWFITSMVFGAGALAIALYSGEYEAMGLALLAGPAALVGSLPALLVLLIALPIIKRVKLEMATKWWLVILLLLLSCMPYGMVATIINATGGYGFNWQEALFTGGLSTGVLFACNGISVAIHHHKLMAWILDGNLKNSTQPVCATPPPVIHSDENIFNQQQINTNMGNEQSVTNESIAGPEAATASGSIFNKTLVKATITAVLILVMLIPTAFIIRLVEERKERQKEVVAEVSSKWASQQTITTPYLFIPYNDVVINDSNKAVTLRKHVMVLAENLTVDNTIKTEERARSIYKVLLYRSEIKMAGHFKINLPKDINPANLFLSEARICVGIKDFKGIEEKLVMQVADTAYDMLPGLPVNSIDDAGLSVPLNLTTDIFAKPLSFNIRMRVKGSGQLHFIPLSANSNFKISSDWHSPSFDGNSLPQEHVINDSGFTAQWSFNQANLPFPTVIKKKEIDAAGIAFGVSLVQPGDQYAQTMRSVKYAILFIGLTFALFFILEISQNKPVHPLQYILIGLALVIFYTLLLSIGEFTGFNIAYGIAAAATILLVALYTHSLFASVKTSALLSSFLVLLYGFIYVLIQLEDTALLAGSIGLFVLLAAAMYYSRRINWYGSARPQNIIAP